MKADATHFDVIIIGAGPAGSACAIPLAASGVRVLLIDKARFPRRKICGDCINPGCWEPFELLGVADSVRSGIYETLYQIRIAGRHGDTVTVQLRKTGPSPFFAMDRKILDSVLLERAVNLGCEVWQGTRVKKILHGSSWQIRCASKDTVTAGFLVGADGRNSIAAARIGEAFSGRTNRDSRVGIQWHIRREPAATGTVEMFLFNSGYFGLVDLGEGHTNLAMVVSAEIAAVAKKNFKEFLSRTVLNNPAAAQLNTGFEPLEGFQTTSPIDPRRSIPIDPDAYLAGDARMTVEPFTGEGIRFALYDGIKVGLEILDRLKRSHSFRINKVRSPFWPNRIFSPMLRNQALGERLLFLASRNRFMAMGAARSIMGG